MPNWCENYLCIRFNQNNQRELMYARKLKKAFDKERLLNAIVKKPKHQPDIQKPNPFFAKGGLGADEQKLFGKNNWYDWSIENWGTKWEISSDGDTAELENGMLTMMFRSAWSPPVQAISKIKLPFELYFWESGAGYMGQLIKDSKSSPAVENSMGINIPEEKTKTEDDVYAFLKEQCENNNINPDIIDYMGMVCSYTEYK